MFSIEQLQCQRTSDSLFHCVPRRSAVIYEKEETRERRFRKLLGLSDLRCYFGAFVAGSCVLNGIFVSEIEFGI